MSRKEAFYITPPFDYESSTPEADTDLPDESSDTGSERENNFDQEEPIENPVKLRAIDKPDDKPVLNEKPKPDTDAQDLKNSIPKITNGTVISNDTDKVAAKSYDYDITFKPGANKYLNRFVTPLIGRNQAGDIYQKDIDELTRKQADIIKQLNNVGGDKDQVDNYNKQFDALMKAIQIQKDWASSTVMILLDENEVKNKLRGDPFVQRILKLAQRRKAEYFKRAQAEALHKN